MTGASKPSGKKRDSFALIAFWQLLVFVLLLCFLWASELLDLPHIVFGAISTPFNLPRACMLSAAIITAGIVAVGHTYEQQRHIVNKLVMTCLYCHRVKSSDGNWEHVEQFFIQNFPVKSNEGSCPECKTMLKSLDSEGQADIEDLKEAETIA
jgi:hypothetical protein